MLPVAELQEMLTIFMWKMEALYTSSYDLQFSTISGYTFTFQGCSQTSSSLFTTHDHINSVTFSFLSSSLMCW
jgi:hypothetical protein